MGREDVVMDDPSDDETEYAFQSNQIRNHRSNSISTPPLPPPDFNPPADAPISPADSIASSIISPTGSSASSLLGHHSSASNSYISITQHLDNSSSHDVSIAAAAAVAANSLSRPSIRALQRVSNESIPGSAGSGASSLSGMSSTSGMEGGEHLVEAREMLLHSGESSRRESISKERPLRSTLDFSVTTPTPPMQPRRSSADDRLRDPMEIENEAGPSRPRRSMSPIMPDEEGRDLPAEHAWDSVWPAPGSSHRHPYASELNRPHFPTAPVSPYVTPAFSPALISTQSIPRKPPSPRLSSSDPSSPNKTVASSSQNQPLPHRMSTREIRISSSPLSGSSPDEATFRRRGSITSSPLFTHPSPSVAPVSISKHQRSFSASSPSYKDRSFHRDTLERGQPTPPISPPSSPNLLTTRSGKSIANNAATPSSPTKSRSRRPGSSEGPQPSSNGLRKTIKVTSKPDSPNFDVPSLTTPGNKGRPRGKSLSDLTRSPMDASSVHGLPASLPSEPDASRPLQPPSPVLSSMTSGPLPPIALPPSVASAPVSIGDDGLPQPRPELAFLSSPLPVNPPPFAPLSRPSIMRRAMSDYDPSGKHRSAPPLNRSISITAELDKSPKRTIGASDMASRTSPRLGADADASRVKKSPRRSPRMLPAAASLKTMSQAANEIPEDDIPPLENEGIPDASAAALEEPTPRDMQTSAQLSDITLVDEGDVLPSSEVQMDVTFDDEGLSTLERIFLLSKSDFPFHRAYVARVLGDLLVEVDPCESVEYVLPLLSGFSMDDDESVKEAFASELHRILWYFFSTCKLVLEEENQEELAGMDYDPVHETVTISAEGVNVVDKPIIDEDTTMPDLKSNSSGVSDNSTNLTHSQSEFDTNYLADQGSDTPATAVSEGPSSAATVLSPSDYGAAFADDIDPEKGWVKDAGPLLDRPPLAVNFFTPLLGSLLLSQNPTIADSVRNGVVNLLVRLRERQDIQPEIWGPTATLKEVEERRIFTSQSGPHSHDIVRFDKASRDMVETELITGIVVGMGHLSTEMPEGLFADSMEEAHRALDGYADENPGTGPGYGHASSSQAELFQEQLIAEATAGRATSMNLIGSLCEFYDADEVVHQGFVDEVLRSGDGDVAVRAEGAVALSCVAKVAPVEEVYNMIPLFEVFLEDPADHVRQSVCLSLPAICKRIENFQYRRDLAVRAVTTLAAKIDDVRCAILEMLGEVIYVFDNDPLGPPPELLEVFSEDVDPYAGLDGDWDVVVAFNFPGVALTLGADRWDELRKLYRRLQTRAGDKIMRILAASLHELAKILRPQQVEADLIPVYERSLTCNDEIRERVYEHVDILVSRVGEEEGWRIFANLARAWKDGSLGGWRAREQLALHLPSFLETYKEVWKGHQVLEVLKDALLDPFAAVRDGVTKGIPEAYVVLGDDSPVAIKFREMLLELGASSKYRRRLTFVRCLREFIKPPPNQHAFETFFVPSLSSLSKDVVDIRLGLAQAIADLFVIGAYYGSRTGPIPKEIRELAETLSKDESRDVKDTLRNVDLKSFGKGEGVPHSVRPREAPDRALRPDDAISHRQEIGKTGEAASRLAAPPSPKNSDLQGSPRSQPTIPPQPSRSPDPVLIPAIDSALQTPSLSKPQPQRRESIEVANKMDTMNLTSTPDLDLDSGEKQLSLGSAGTEGSLAPPLDPFAMSFSHAPTLTE